MGILLHFYDRLHECFVLEEGGIKECRCMHVLNEQKNEVIFSELHASLFRDHI
jgi:hypothetical protein